MTNLSIPKEWRAFVSSSHNRVFVNPASGCRANCAYCYIYEYGHPHTPHIFGVSGNEISCWLQSQKAFHVGKNGTLISIGSSCDPFDREVTSKTLELVKALSPLENPLQLSTKYYVSDEAADYLDKYQVKSGQIVLYTTITTFEHWKTVEPGADEPCLRLKGLVNARKHGITTCLYIKPVLPGLTEYETVRFMQAIEQHDIPYCVLGLAYRSEKMIEKMKGRGLLTEGLETENTDGRPPPSKENEIPLYASIDEMLKPIQQIRSNLETADVECVLSSPCVMALSYDIQCPTGVWRYFPDLCTKCRAKCASR